MKANAAVRQKLEEIKHCYTTLVTFAETTEAVTDRELWRFYVPILSATSCRIALTSLAVETCIRMPRPSA